MTRTVLPLYTVFLLLGVGQLVVSQQSYRGSCQTIIARMCSSMRYNSAFLPNRFGHTHIVEATLQIGTFSPMVMANCSTALRPFLCGTYFPKCSPRGGGIEPCAKLCRKAWADCEPWMTRVEFYWPVALDCRTFAENYRCNNME